MKRNKLYKIYIENLELSVIIGLLDHERVQKQRVIINCEIEYDMESDKYIDYVKVIEIIKSSLEEKKYILLENALPNIINTIKSSFSKVYSIRLKINKPDIIKNCNVAVESFIKY